MLLLASTSDLIRVITSQAVATDVHCSWVDLSGSTVTPGRTNTAISTATTTTIVGSPASSTYRTVKSIAITNTHASTTQQCTIEHSDGTTIVELIDVLLQPGWSLHYDEGQGWTTRDGYGRRADLMQSGGGVAATVSEMTTVVLASDVTNNNASANTIADVTGLSFSVTAGELYWFRFVIHYTAAATTTGSRWSINGPSSPTQLRYRSQYSLTTTTDTINTATAYDVPAASNATSAATAGDIAVVEGFIQPSANGTVIARFASEVASSAIVAKAGSVCHYMRVL